MDMEDEDEDGRAMLPSSQEEDSFTSGGGGAHHFSKILSLMPKYAKQSTESDKSNQPLLMVNGAVGGDTIFDDHQKVNGRRELTTIV